MKTILKSVMFSAAVLAGASAFAELRISEVCPRPTALDPNGMESGWVELYNDGDAAVNLKDYELVRVNRGKALKSAGRDLASRVVPAHGYTVVYTSEEYPNALDESLKEFDKVVVVNDAMIVPQKVNPKKFPLIALYRDGTLVDQVAVPVDLPDNQSVAPCGQTASYSGSGDAKATIVNAASVRSLILPTITKGAANNLAGAIPYGPNVGPLAGVKHDFTDLAATVPAEPGRPYTVKLAVNPVADADANAIKGVKLLTRVWSIPASGSDDNRQKAPSQTTHEYAMMKGEVVAGQGQLWTVDIPAADLPAPGLLLQWAAVITEQSGNSWRSPSFRNKDDGYEWYGTITAPTADQLSKKLQTWHVFVSQSDYWMVNINQSGYRCDIYDSSTSNYYNNVEIGTRGNSTANYKNCNKMSHTLKFNKCKPMTCENPFDGEQIETRKTSLLAELADPARLRSCLSCWTRRQAGMDVPFCYPVRVQMNGLFYQLDFHTNRFKDELLVDYFGYDPNGIGIKNVGTLGGNNMSGGSTYELPEGDQTSAKQAFETGNDSFRKLVGLSCTLDNKLVSGADKVKLDAFVAKSFDLPAWFTFLAMSCICQENDDSWANLCLYCDRYGTGTWRPMAYDLHQSWGAWIRYDSYGTSLFPWASEDIKGKSHPLFGGRQVLDDANNNRNWANRGFEAVFQSDKYRRLYLRRLRTLLDTILMAPGTSKEDTPFWRYAMPLVEAMKEDDLIDRKRWLDKYNGKIACGLWVWPGYLTFDEGVDDLWDNYVVPRRVHLFETHCVSNTAKPVGYGRELNAGIPLKQSAISALKGGFSVESVPGGAVIRNANAETVDMSGWKLSGPVVFTMPAGTVIDQRIGDKPGEVYVVTDRIAYVAANDATITEEIIVGNAKVGAGQLYALDDAAGEHVISSVSPIGEALRFHSFDGVPAGDPDGDKGEWIALTNLNAKSALDISGVRIVIIKDGDTVAKCDFTVPAETEIPAGGAVRLDQATCGWMKITNNKIKMFIYDVDGTTLVQSSSVTQKSFPSYYGAGGPGGSACLVAKAFGQETTGADWVASDFVVPPAPASEFYTGVYGEPVTIADSGDYTFSNATFNAGLVLGSGTYVFRNVKGTTNTASRVSATGAIVFKQAGAFKLAGTGTEPLMTVRDLIVSNGTFIVDYTGTAAKSAAVNVAGNFAVEDKGTVDVTIGGVQSYGIFVANKDNFCRVGGGGTFLATVNGQKCAALYGNKGSVDGEVENDTTVVATLNGNEARLFNFAGKIKLKGGAIAVTAAESSVSNKVFKSDKSITVKRGARIKVDAPGKWSEAFSCADTFEMEGGHVEVVSGDDCVGAETNVVITGGKFYGRSLGNDVFDTNAGDVTVDDGLVLAYTTAQEPTATQGKTVGSFGFDVNGYQVNLNGGTVVAIGGDNLKGDHFPALAGSQPRFVDEAAEASKYSGKYVSYSSNGTNTTVRLPAIDSTKCTVLFTVPGMPEGAKIVVSDVAPTKGSLDFHDVYVTEPEPLVPFALGDPAARPQLDYNGSVITVGFTGDVPDGAEVSAKVTLGGVDYVGAIDAAAGVIAIAVPESVVTSGNTYEGTVTVSVGNENYTKSVKLEQGTFKFDEHAGWIAETPNGFGTTGDWTGTAEAVGEEWIAVSNATFTAESSAPADAIVTISMTADFAGVAEEPFDTSKRAGIRVVKVGGVNRYAVLTADGVVTNFDYVAEVGSSVEVQIVLDNANGTVSYAVRGRQQLGTFPMAAKAQGVSSVSFTGGTEIGSLFGDYRFEGLDVNLAKAGGVEYATVADAVASGKGGVELLWDASWNPSKGGDYNFATNGFNLVIGGSLAYLVKDNGDGTLTVSVTGGATPDAPEAASVTIVGNTVRVGVAEISADCWYALEKTTDLTKDFVIDASTWTKGSDLLVGTTELSIKLGGGEPQAFYRVVVSATAP